MNDNNVPRADIDSIPDTDGKPDFTEGVTYHTALNIARGAPYDSLEELRAARKKLSFLDKAKLTWKGETRLGRIAGTLLDVGELIAPRWAVKIRDSLQPKTTDSTMKDILKRVFTKANGGFIRLWDELSGRDWKYYVAFILRVAIILGIFYAADYLGLPLDKVISAIFGA